MWLKDHASKILFSSVPLSAFPPVPDLVSVTPFDPVEAFPFAPLFSQLSKRFSSPSSFSAFFFCFNVFFPNFFDDFKRNSLYVASVAAPYGT